MELDGQSKKDNNRIDYYRWFGFGFEFCCVIAFFCYLGFKLDQYFKTSPWLFLTGFFISFLGMMYLTIKDLSKKGDNKRK